MPFDDAGSPPVRPMADFEGALDQALAPLDRVMGSRQRGEALARARREILAAAEAAIGRDAKERGAGDDDGRAEEGSARAARQLRAAARLRRGPRALSGDRR
jgi:exonuclease VII small subunit